jgi:DNA-binding NtrC family response regulator
MTPKLSILVLDDERIVCDRVQTTMEKLGFHVEAFTDSRKALDRVAVERFDVVVTDLKMPGPGGIDVLKFVREQHPTTRVVVITGFATAEAAREALKQGAVDFIPKPFRLSQLRDLILRIAEERSARSEGADDERSETT